MVSGWEWGGHHRLAAHVGWYGREKGRWGLLLGFLFVEDAEASDQTLELHFEDGLIFPGGEVEYAVLLDLIQNTFEARPWVARAGGDLAVHGLGFSSAWTRPALPEDL